MSISVSRSTALTREVGRGGEGGSVWKTSCVMPSRRNKTRGARNDGQNYKKMTGATAFLDHVETSWPLH